MNASAKSVRCLRTLAIVVAVSALAGCVTETHPTAPPGAAFMPPPQQEFNAAGFNGKTHSVDEVINYACASRLHDLEGYLLMYFHDHHELPAQLSDLQSEVGPGEPPLELTCPDSHLPYGYAPDGIAATDPQLKNYPILVYDPTPAHKGAPDGVRYCIFGMPPSPGQNFWTFQVTAVSEGVFRTYAVPASAIVGSAPRPGAAPNNGSSPNSGGGPGNGPANAPGSAR